jgi:D-amino-acid oxidase
MIILGKSAIHNSKDWESYSKNEYYETDSGEDIPQHIINKNRDIIKKIVDLDITNFEIFGTSGYRPYREDGIRVERENNFIHNYGHGGSGVTFSWGSTLKAVDNIIDNKEEIKKKVVDEIKDYEPNYI